MDRSSVRVKVICRKQSDIQKKYNALGIETAVEPELLLFSPSEKGWKQNLSLVKNAFPDLIRGHQDSNQLAREIENDFDVVHFNHASLFVLAARLRKKTGKPFSMHIRTRPEDTVLTRLQSRSILKNCDKLVYITENEQEHFKALAGKAPGTVIFNPTTSPAQNSSTHPRIPDDRRLKIASLKSFRPSLGHSRLVEIAQKLSDRGETDKVLFVMAGDMRLWPSLPGALGAVAARGGDFEAYVNDLGLAEFFHFLGWVPDPEQVLSACDLLAVPSMENNPWGRDVIEALSLGKPVLATGEWDGFIKDGETGLLAANFEAENFADELLNLFDDRAKLDYWGETGRRHIASICSPPDRAHDLQELWHSVAHRQA